MVPLIVLVTLLGTGYALSRSDEAVVDASSTPSDAAVAAAPVAAPFRPQGLVASARAEESRLASGASAYSELLGRNVPVEDMAHENMQPHYRGAPPGQRQAPAVLERFGAAVGDTVPRTDGVKAMFPAQRDRLVGTDTGDWERRRTAGAASRTLQGERPFQPQLVAPGMGGYGAERAAAKPRGIDELRTVDNRHVSLPARTNAGRAVNAFGPLPPSCAPKNRPATAFVTPASSMLPSGAAVTRARMDGEQLLPETTRGVKRADLTGVAAPAAPGARGGYSTENETLRYKQVGPTGQHVGVATRTGAALVDPPSYQAILRDNERQGLAPMPLGGAAPAGGALGDGSNSRPVAVGRPGIRSLTTAHPRTHGNLQGVMPAKMTIYDPNEVARTTIKETLIHDTREGFAAGPSRTGARQPGAALDPTTRDTLPSLQGAEGDGRLTATTSVHRSLVYDPDDIPRTTDRETLTTATRAGGVGTLQAGTGYETAPRDVAETQRQFVNDNQYTGAVSGSGRNGYLVAPTDVANTQRQFISDNQHTGVAGAAGAKAQMSYSQVYARAMNEIREMVLVGRDPAEQGAKVATGVDGVGAGAGGRRDPALDVTQHRNTMQRQGAVQTYVPEACSKDTRAPREVHASRTPDLDMLTQLQSNPYAQRISEAV